MAGSTHWADYRIGIICALSTEFTAVKAMLDEDHGFITGKPIDDHNAYLVGKIHQHNIVAACLPSGRDGLAAAAKVATNMKRTFQPRFCILVGIGGGIPSIDKGIDIRLGDVVISQPNGTNGGVVQYDWGKWKNDSGSRWERKGFLNAPPEELLTALQVLKTEHVSNGSKIPGYLAQMTRRLSGETQHIYDYPGTDKDILHNETGLAIRQKRNVTPPVLHYGTIASGNAVCKDSARRAQIQNDCDALCVEMEAAGLMNNFPCLVVRGIADYADEHKNDLWHDYAAATAAAFTKWLLLYVALKPVHGDRVLPWALDDRALQPPDPRVLVGLQEEQKLKLDCLQALHTSSYSDYKDINRKAVPGTCQWLVRHPTFCTWFDDPAASLLWVSADPGSGKSVLSRYLVDDFFISTPPSTARKVCYFFFKDNQDQESLSTALGAILHQVFSQQPELLKHALPLWSRSGSQMATEVGQLLRLLRTVVDDPDIRPIICVIDGLDECRDRDRKRLIEFLCEYHQSCLSQRQPALRKSAIKFLVTSRPYGDIQDVFARGSSNLPSIRLRGENEHDQIHQEINLAIDEWVLQLRQEQQLSPQNAARISDALRAQRNCTYLWLVLVIDHIRHTFAQSLRPEIEPIPLLPHTVDVAYEQLLCRITSAKSKETVKTILSIVVAARRPLTVAELTLALDTATSKKLSSLGELVIRSEHVEQRVRDWCGLFIFFDRDKVYLLHQTAKEFLMKNACQHAEANQSWKGCLQSAQIEALMAKVCVGFLTIREFADPALHWWIRGQQNKEEKKLWSRSHPFSAASGMVKRLLHNSCTDFKTVVTLFKYAAENWMHHFRDAEEEIDANTNQAALCLYDATSILFGRMYSWSPPSITNAEARSIILAADYGHAKNLEHFLLQTPQHINSHDDLTGKTALGSATKAGHIQAVRTLLKYGADVEIPGGSKWIREPSTALAVAIARNDLLTATCLLEATPTGSWTLEEAYLTALRQGNVSIISQLKDHGLDVSVELGNWSPEEHLPSWPYAELHRRIDISVCDHASWGGALHMLVWKGDAKLFHAILKLGANVNSRSEFTGSVLATVCLRFSREIFDLVWDARADTDPISGRLVDHSVFFTAVELCDKDIVQLFLDRGVDVGARNARGLTALHVATERGDETVVEVLLNGGVHVDAIGRACGTALHIAARRGRSKITRLLLMHNADVNIVALQGETALRAACIRGHPAVADELLNSGLVSDYTCGEYGTVLHAAAIRGHIDIVVLLLESGVDPDSFADTLGSALQAAVLSGQQSTAHRLLEYGADAVGRGGPFDCAICAARANDYHHIQKLLLDYGAKCPASTGLHDLKLTGYDASGFWAGSTPASSECSSTEEIYEDEDPDFEGWLSEHILHEAERSDSGLSPSRDYDDLSGAASFTHSDRMDYSSPTMSLIRVTEEFGREVTDQTDMMIVDDCPSPSHVYDPLPLYLLESDCYSE